VSQLKIDGFEKTCALGAHNVIKNENEKSLFAASPGQPKKYGSTFFITPFSAMLVQAA